MTSESVIFLATALFGGGVFGVVIKSWADKRKTASESSLLSAQATDVLVQAGERTVEMLGAQLDKALQRIAALENEVQRLKTDNQRLKDEIAGRPGGRRVADPPLGPT